MINKYIFMKLKRTFKIHSLLFIKKLQIAISNVYNISLIAPGQIYSTFLLMHANHTLLCIIIHRYY